jgi:hypothetical protein
VEIAIEENSLSYYCLDIHGLWALPTLHLYLKIYMSSKEYEIIDNFLGEFFRDEFYKIAIKNAKNKIDFTPQHQLTWQQVKDIIHKQNLSNGEPLSLVHNGANKVLDKNSDEEAYIWLKTIISNIDRNDGNIDEY